MPGVNDFRPMSRSPHVTFTCPTLGAYQRVYTAKMVAERHSFVVLDASPDVLKLRAIDVAGKVFDQVTLTKPQE